MTINKRELQLSQDLIELQSHYNILVSEKKAIRSLLLIRDAKIAELEDTVSILKSQAKNETKVAVKKYAAKGK